MSSSSDEHSPRDSIGSSDSGSLSFDSDDDGSLATENDGEKGDQFQIEPESTSDLGVAVGADTKSPSPRHRPSRRNSSQTDGAALLRPPARTKKPSFSGGPSQDHSARQYADTLRNVRAVPAGHRGSISIAAGAGAIGGHLSEETRRRHRESKKRLECADLTQKLLLQAHEFDQMMDDVPLWLHASIIPPRWRIQIMEHLTSIHGQMQFCRERVLHAWRLLVPPFDQANLQEFETRLRLFDMSVINFSAAVKQCEDRVTAGERESACVFLQLWYRRLLAQRGFYTKLLTISRHHRGLIPGMFDTISGASKLTIHKATHEIRLEYPSSPSHAKHGFRA